MQDTERERVTIFMPTDLAKKVDEQVIRSGIGNRSAWFRELATRELKRISATEAVATGRQ